MNPEVIEAVKLIAICVLGGQIVTGVTIYAIIRTLTTGKAAFFERRERDYGSRIHQA